MKTLTRYIFEDDKKKVKNESDQITSTIKRSDIKFVIWKAPEKKVRWIADNEKYLKIEYKLEDKKDGISIDFLLGFKDNTWKMWVGKIGSCSYDDDPYCDLKTTKFHTAILSSLDEISKFVKKVKDDPENYIQFYPEM